MIKSKTYNKANTKRRTQNKQTHQPKSTNLKSNQTNQTTNNHNQTHEVKTTIFNNLSQKPIETSQPNHPQSNSRNLNKMGKHQLLP